MAGSSVVVVGVGVVPGNRETAVSEDFRSVPLDALQADLIEEVGLDLLRQGDYGRGHRLLAIHLSWRVCPQVAGDRTSSDVPTADASERPPQVRRLSLAAASPDPAAEPPLMRPGRPSVFRCDIDESAGVSDLRFGAWSRKV